MLPLLHPMLVHFAMGLLLVSVVFDVLGLARTSEKLMFAGYWNMVVGSVMAALAAGTGLYAQAHLGPHSSIGDALLGVHKLFGLFVVALALVLAAWRLSMKGYILPRRRTLYLTGAFFTAFVIVVTGGLGGTLVYTFGIGLPPSAAQHVLDSQPKTAEKGPELPHPMAVPSDSKIPKEGKPEPKVTKKP
jgi:uncharacterized membrane protein